MSKLYIKCPYCSTKLKIPAMPEEVRGRFLTCPICKHRSPLSEYKVLSSAPVAEATFDEGEQIQRPVGQPQRPAVAQNSDSTIPDFNIQKQSVIGTIVMPNGSKVQLHLGVNTIGRRASGSMSEIQFPDILGTKKASRHHARIEVVPRSNGEYMHTITNWENKNPTTVNGVVLAQGDAIVLHSGAQICCGDVMLRFVIEDPELGM